jgi:hypothetical protein
MSQKERWQVIQYVQVLQNGGKMPEFDENGNLKASQPEAEQAPATDGAEG